MNRVFGQTGMDIGPLRADAIRAMDHDQHPITNHLIQVPARRDPGTPLTHLLSIVLGIVCFGIVAFSQNSLPEQPGEGETASVAIGDNPVGMEADILYRMSIRLGKFMDADPNAATMLSGYAATEREQLYLAVAVGELDGAEAAIEHLPVRPSNDVSEKSSKADDPFWLDVNAFERIYAFARDGGEGAPVEAGVLDKSTAEGLHDRHGYYADVALTFPLATVDPERTSLRTPGAAFVGVVMLVMGIVAAIFAGFCLFIVAIVLISTGRIKWSFVPPMRGGSVFLEVFALFVAGFLCLKLVMGLVARDAGADAEWPSFVSMSLQWGLLVVPFWPLVRGMKWETYAKAIGLYRGRGIFREVGAGIVGYLAGLPIFIGAAILVVILMAIKQSLPGNEGATPPSNPMLELVGGSSPLMLVLFFLTATIWAPLCEELVFRGALFRHLSGYMPVVVAAITAGLMFAFMHNYGVFLTPPLIALGFNFAMMRAWRGSLIGPMTAHALHNGTLLILIFVLLRSIGG